MTTLLERLSYWIDALLSSETLLAATEPTMFTLLFSDTVELGRKEASAGSCSGSCSEQVHGSVPHDVDLELCRVAARVDDLGVAFEANALGYAAALRRGQEVDLDGRAGGHAQLRIAVQPELAQAVDAAAERHGRIAVQCQPPGGRAPADIAGWTAGITPRGTVPGVVVLRRERRHRQREWLGCRRGAVAVADVCVRPENDLAARAGIAFPQMVELLSSVMLPFEAAWPAISGEPISALLFSVRSLSDRTAYWPKAGRSGSAGAPRGSRGASAPRRSPSTPPDGESRVEVVVDRVRVALPVPSASSTGGHQPGSLRCARRFPGDGQSPDRDLEAGVGRLDRALHLGVADRPVAGAGRLVHGDAAERQHQAEDDHGDRQRESILLASRRRTAASAESARATRGSPRAVGRPPSVCRWDARRDLAAARVGRRRSAAWCRACSSGPLDQRPPCIEDHCSRGRRAR